MNPKTILSNGGLYINLNASNNINFINDYQNNINNFPDINARIPYQPDQFPMNNSYFGQGISQYLYQPNQNPIFDCISDKRITPNFFNPIINKNPNFNYNIDQRKSQNFVNPIINQNPIFDSNLGQRKSGNFYYSNISQNQIINPNSNQIVDRTPCNPKQKISNESIIPTNLNKKPCGIINYGNNCYLNSGLHILSSCNKLIQELDKYRYVKCGLIKLLVDAFYKIFRDEIYDPIDLYTYFCRINNESFKAQYCSQNFIRKSLKILNDELLNYKDIHYITEYLKYEPTSGLEKRAFNQFLENNKNFPESTSLNLFTTVSKNHSYGICNYCKKYNEDYSFCYFIDQNIYLDNIPRTCNFSELLFTNIGKMNDLTMNCKGCNREITIKEDTKYIKLPDILIFTLERYQENINNSEIIPDEKINIKAYIDNSLHISDTIYELFAINIRLGSTRDFGHEICQIKRNFEWYEINDTKSYKRTREYNKNSYGLFYKKITNLNNHSV